jgi:RTX calcium-binding nonapeptide repeat (4 copies)
VSPSPYVLSLFITLVTFPFFVPILGSARGIYLSFIVGIIFKNCYVKIARLQFDSSNMIKIMITIVPTLFFALFLLLCSSSSFDNMILSVSAERIDGTPQNDNLTGTPDNDRITGYGGNDTLVGLAGSDEIDGSRGEILLVGQKMTIIL